DINEKSNPRRKEEEENENPKNFGKSEQILIKSITRS
ncbi:unnamed protein product, partial [marine sediment metagenome]